MIVDENKTTTEKTETIETTIESELQSIGHKDGKREEIWKKGNREKRRENINVKNNQTIGLSE